MNNSCFPFRKTRHCYFLISLLLILGGLIFGLFSSKGNLLQKKELTVLGFLPYWNLTEDLQLDLKVVDQLIYFSLMVDQYGNFITSDSGWIVYQTEELDKLLERVKQSGKKSLICIASFDAEVMYRVTLTIEARQQLIDNIISVVQEKDFDGVDIDFEYFEQIGHQGFGDNFNAFLIELRKALDEVNPDLILSVDIYPKAIIEDEPYNLIPLGTTVDQLIIMAYDYTQSRSPQAGPVAPIDTDPNLEIEDNYSIQQTFKITENKIDKDKVFLGIPLYGYQWQTVDGQHRSQSLGGIAETVNYQMAKELIKEKNLEINWDDLAQSPWLTYAEKGTNYQLYFENLESLKIKFKAAADNKIKGVAFWALGYEGKETDLWEHLRKEYR